MKVNRIECGNGNCYLIEGEQGSILVDVAKTKHKEEIIEQCKGKNVKLIVLTHGHIDHCQNAKAIAEALDVPIAMAKADEELISSNLKQSLEAKSIMGKIVLKASIDTFEKEIIEPFTPTITLKEGDRLDEYGIKATIIELPGHTNGSIGIDLYGDGVIVGDALMNMFGPTVSMLYHNQQQMLESAKRISGLGERFIYFGHGAPVRNKNWVKQ